ncbi:putative ribonuclease H-like domain-containing protein [Tanacetum coccineum]
MSQHVNDDFSQHVNDDLSQHLSDDEASYHEDASDNEGGNGNLKKRISTRKDGVVRILPSVSAVEIHAIKKERKARTILLMAIPKEHLRRFHGMDDAKEIWEAIRTRFGGNANSKKMQKAVLKQQFEAFTISSSEGLEKEYDRFQQLLSQLEAHGDEVSTDDANHKFFRSLPPAWSNLAMTMRTKPDVDTLSIDDLYNNLRVFEQELISTSKSSTSAQNVAFVSHNKSSNNKVKSSHTSPYSTYTPSTPLNNIPKQEVPAGFADEVIYSLFAKQSEDLDLLHEDLEQIDDVDIEEMDINWQIAMIAIRMKKFYKKTGRRVRIDGNKPVGFDKKKLECFKCHNTGHFARECTSKGTNDGKKRDSFYQDQGAGKKEQNQNCLLTMDDGVVNWGEHTVEEEETNHALMAISSNNEVSLCSKTCIDSYNKLKTLCDDQMNQLGEQEAKILAYTLAVKKLEAQVVTFQKQQLSLNEQLTFQANEIYAKDEKLKKYRRIGMKAVKEKEQLQKTNKEDFLNKPLYSRFSKIDNFKGVPHPLTGDYTPKPQEEIDDSFEGSFGNPSEHSSESESESISVPKEMSTSKSVTTNEKVVSEPKSTEVEPSCVTHVKTPRQQMKNQETPKVNRKNWNEMMERELREDPSTQRNWRLGCIFDSGCSGHMTAYQSNESNYGTGRFSWVFFLAIKDETSSILQNFIRQIENQLNHRVKIIRSDNGTEFKNMDMLEFCGNKGIKQEYSNARTLQQNENQTNPHAGTLEVTNSAGTLHTPNANASEEEDEAGELIVVPTEVRQISEALKDDSWVEAMQEELLQFRLQEVWILVDLPHGAKYVSQPPGFVDPDHPKKVYKVVKALYGLHQTPRAWYATLSTFLEEHGYRRGTIDKTLFIKKDKKDIMLVQVYVDDIIFGSTRKSWCDEFEALMKGRFQMSSMGELIFFLGLQVKQKTDGIFISQDKYVADMLKKFDLTSVKTAITPMETKMALTKDEEADEVDVHLYRSMIGSLMYLTASRPDIMFAVCACSRFQVTPKTSHLNAVKRIFKYLKGKPNLGLWYPRESSFDLEAFSDSDYAGANLDRKSTTGGCQFLGSRLISWQCKKQTIVATSTTEAEYVAAASCCGQVLWIQNQMLDYGFNFMNTKIHIDNESTICIVKNPVYHSKTKHIEIRHHFIRDSYEKKLIRVEKIHTDFNVADLLTKAFDGPRFNFLVVNIGIAWICRCKEGVIRSLFFKSGSVNFNSGRLPLVLTATAKTLADGTLELQATIDTIEYTITEASIRRQEAPSVTQPQPSSSVIPPTPPITQPIPSEATTIPPLSQPAPPTPIAETTTASPSPSPSPAHEPMEHTFEQPSSDQQPPTPRQEATTS